MCGSMFVESYVIYFRGARTCPRLHSPGAIPISVATLLHSPHQWDQSETRQLEFHSGVKHSVSLCGHIYCKCVLSDKICPTAGSTSNDHCRLLRTLRGCLKWPVRIFHRFDLLLRTCKTQQKNSTNMNNKKKCQYLTVLGFFWSW